MNIVFIGYRASGKTLVCKRLAEWLAWPALDVDCGIIEKEGGRTIKEIFEESGEPYYRNIESDVAKEFLQCDRSVISFGGGTIMLPEIQELIVSSTKVVYLEALPNLLWDRAQADANDENNRPSLLGGIRGEEEIVAMLATRCPVYEHVADIIVDASLNPDTLVGQILDLLDLQHENLH